MPAPLVRKLRIDIANQLITAQVGGPDLFPGFNPIKVRNIADLTSATNTALTLTNHNPNQNFPSPNKISNMFDRNIGTSFRSKGPRGDLNDATQTGTISYLVLDLGKGRDINRVQVMTNHSTKVSVKIRFAEKLDGGVPATCTGVTNAIAAILDDQFNIFSIPPGTNTDHDVVNQNGTISTINSFNVGRTNRFVAENSDDIFGFNNKQFLILEFFDSEYSNTFDIADISVFENIDSRDFNVEFDDALLDLQGWKNPRYDGSKLTAKEINKFNPGDITFGRNPVLEKKTTALYIADTVIGGEDEDEQFCFIDKHSYVGIKQILLIDTETDEVQLIDRDSEDFIPFNKFVTSDFPLGSKAKMRVLDEAIQSKLKNDYFVKFNRGYLLKSFEYDGFKPPKHGLGLDGKEILKGQFNPLAAHIQQKSPFALYESIEQKITNLNVDGDPAYASFYLDENGAIPSVSGLPPVASVIPNFLSQSFSHSPFYRGKFNFGASFGAPVPNHFLFTYDRDPLTKTLKEPEPGVNSIYNDGTGVAGNRILGTGRLKFTFSNAANMPLMLGDNTKLIKNKFTDQIVSPLNDGLDNPVTFDLPTFEEIKARTNDNIDQGAFGSIFVSPGLDPNATQDNNILGVIQGTQPYFQPRPAITDFPIVTASAFIKGCVNFAEQNDELTELYLTLHRGTKDFSFDGTSSKNDSLSISTFEVDANIAPIGNNLNVNNFVHSGLAANETAVVNGYFNKNGDFDSVPPPVTDDNPVGSISVFGDRKMDLFLKNDPKVRPAFHQLVEDDKREEHCTTVQTTLIEIVENNPGNPGSNSLLQIAAGTEPSIQFNTSIPALFHGGGVDPFFIVERTKCFDAGPGSPVNAVLGKDSLSGSSAPGFIGSDIIVKNTNNYSGSQDNGYHIQLSFLDKAHALVLNIDKQTELFDGIGSRGVVLIPELTEQLVKDNVDYYLRKGGVISRKTIKAPRRPEKGR